HRRELASRRGEVDSGSGGGDGNVGTRADEELCRGLAAGFENAASAGGQSGGVEVFFTELDEVDAVGGPEGSLAEECRQLAVGRAGEERSVCYGIAAHGASV